MSEELNDVLKGFGDKVKEQQVFLILGLVVIFIVQRQFLTNIDLFTLITIAFSLWVYFTYRSIKKINKVVVVN